MRNNKMGCCGCYRGREEARLERVIRVCPQKPAVMERDVIYVLRKAGSVDVQAVSREPFVYRDFSRGVSPVIQVSEVTNLVGDSNGYWHIPFETVLETLKQDNSAQIIYSRN